MNDTKTDIKHQDFKDLEKLLRYVEVAGNTVPPPEPKEKRVRKRNEAPNYCFTLWNPTEEDIKSFKDENLHKNVRYLVYQIERGNESGKLHLQGYFELTKSSSITWCKNNINKNFSKLIVARGTAEQNRVYCSKESTKVGGPWEVGTPKKQGQRTDLKQCSDIIAKGGTVKDVAQLFPTEFVKFHKGFKELYNILQSERDGSWRPDLIIIIGEPGIGKSKTIFDMEKGFSVYVKPDNTPWWDGYRGQEVVIINEYQGELGMAYMNNLIDYYPHQVQVKGGYVNFNSKRVYITSNKKIEDWWTGDISSFKRRITRIIDIKELGKLK